MKRNDSQLTLFTFALCFSIVAPTSASEAAKGKKTTQLELKNSAYATPWERYKGWPETLWSEFSTLTKMVPSPIGKPIKIEGAIEGDPKKGEKLAFDRARGGSCLACHVMGKPTPSLPGNVGFDLSTHAIWGRSDEYIFNYIFDPRNTNPNSVMPPWGAHKLFSVEEIKDMVAFLKTQNSPAEFRDDLENPTTRPVPKEERDNLDPFVNEAMAAMEKGKVLYARAGPRKQSCASCHAEPERMFKNWAAAMPKYEPRLRKVIGVEEFVTRHARATTGDEFLLQSDQNIALSIYMRYLANGQPINVDTQSKAHKLAIQRGTKLLNTKIGQMNLACVDCHTAERGGSKWIRGQWLGEFRGQQGHFPTWRTSRTEIWDINKRFQWCNVSVRANELQPGSAEYGDLELTLSALNKGIKISVPGIRH
ncbi:MAG: sulfur oxidation c-type cytochrome SoxA [Rhodocyclaceae bacterium]|nr:sulfur oxidation c-type cytochrome SoxA [Rhodocyclaceae bacterium]